ncbi:restriction endonuclease subunit S [Bremerella sp. T1]|uniref:restriction endonuclease subunit S n=1 Tax=Bremerella sp. TYQ1 TaxID=3119568 RepID=UPI001CCDAE79|nr:restriction endonuclease subunit S [Bremerella volcania]UBM35197.1 restriction endonuclease subunit S [Bremerella volcania]
MKTGISDSGLNLTHGRFKRLEVPVAPLLEQKRIVEKIDELFSELDAGVAALERAKANLKRYRASVLKAAVNGSLTADWRAKHPKVEPASQLLERILAERRHKWEEEQLAKFEAAGKKPPKDWEKKYKEPEPPLMEELPELPDGWCWSSVDQLCDVATGTTPSRGRLDYYENGSIPWVMSTAVNDPLIVNGTEMVTERALEETSLRLYPIGTLLIALYGEGKTRGMVSELKIAATINQALGALVFHESSECIRAYLKQFLWSRYLELRRKAAGGMQPNLNLGLVRQIAVPLPPVGEQVEIVRDVEEALTQIDAAQHAVHCSEIRSARLRQSILKVAFEGNLVPQDSNDESAKELLARITNKCEAEQTKKAHKAKAKPKKRIKIPKQVFENRAAVVSYTVQRLTSSQSFGRIQLLKTMHLAQCHLGIEMGFSFERYEAGPFDAAIYPLEKVAIKEDWFTTKERKRYGVTYHPGEKIDEMCQKAVEFLGEKKPELDQLLDHIAEMNTDEAELFATAYAAWNDLLLDDRSADDDAIIEEIYAWHEKKKKFTPDVIQKRLAWMRRHKFIPVGLRPGTSKATESERRSK